MTEATESLRLTQLRASISLATNTLARQRAIKEAKRQLQAQSLRPSQFSHRDLVIRADQYLDQHRADLIAEAKQIVLRWQAEGFFGKRAKLLSDAQGGKARNTEAFCVQNSSSK
jgi:hypothetical protein